MNEDICLKLSGASRAQLLRGGSHADCEEDRLSRMNRPQSLLAFIPIRIDVLTTLIFQRPIWVPPTVASAHFARLFPRKIHLILKSFLKNSSIPTGLFCSHSFDCDRARRVLRLFTEGLANPEPGPPAGQRPLSAASLLSSLPAAGAAGGPPGPPASTSTLIDTDRHGDLCCPCPGPAVRALSTYATAGHCAVTAISASTPVQSQASGY